jgi:vitamin K-dependent gamma-carboxylase
VRDEASGEVWTVRPSDVLTDWQAATATVRTDLLLDTAHLIARQAQAAGHTDVEVYADAFVAWNGRLRQRWVDPTVDLATVSEWAPVSDWILPPNPPQYD